MTTVAYSDIKIKDEQFAGRDTLGQVARANEQFYGDNYANELTNLRNTGLGLGGTAGDAYGAARQGIGDAGRLFDVAAGGYGRAQARMGRVNQRADQTANQTSRLSLARIISQVDAGNRGTERAIGIQRDAQAQGTQLYNAMSNNSSRILADIANQETDREAQRQGYNASRKASTLGMIGQAAGLAISAASLI